MSGLAPRALPTIVLAVLALLACAATAGAVTPKPLALHDGWEFALDPADTGEPESGWERVSVPHVFDPRPLKESYPGTIGWYRLRFRGPATPGGWSWALRFEGVRRTSQIWLNGEPIGTNDKPYTPFEVPARNLLPIQDNTLLVRVDNRRTPGWREGWWNWGGITRGVTLVPQGRVELHDVGLLSKVRCEERCSASVLFDARVTTRSTGAVRPLLTVNLQPPGGGDPIQKIVRVRATRPGETARVQFELPVPGTPKLWSPDDPNLYRATVQTRLGSSIESSEQHRVGLRAVEVRDGLLWLNGRRLDLRGASIQEDMPGRGPALTDADVDRIVADLKAVHANVTRAHYLLDERLLNRLDEEGILVWSQAPVYHRDVQLRTPEGFARELDSVRRTILAARNHASVLTHSVANELSSRADELEPTRRFLEKSAALARDLDPTLPVSVDILGWPNVERQEAYAGFDLLGINSYFGWYAGKGTHLTGNLADLEPFLKLTRRQYPDQALVMTEFGAESTMDGPADVKETYAFQARYLQQNLDIVKKVGFMSGAIYWTLREFAVKPDWDGGALRDVPRDGIHNKAIMTYDGDRKPAWAIAARDFESTPLYRSPSPAERLAARTPAAASFGVLPATATLLLLLLLGGLAWLIIRVGRDVLRFGDIPAPARRPHAEEPPERRLRAVA
jgi:beta-glucuronidase